MNNNYNNKKGKSYANTKINNNLSRITIIIIQIIKKKNYKIWNWTIIIIKSIVIINLLEHENIKSNVILCNGNNNGSKNKNNIDNKYINAHVNDNTF